MATLPKISYVLLSHNREKYIRAALESAFAQDYEGELEYIISDDCSTDRTFEIIQECVANYKGGRRVVVTQPPGNVRTAENFNHALSFAKGDWVVRADDDDLSVVDRCALIGKIAAEHPECMYIATDSTYTFIDVEEPVALERASSPCPETVEAIVVDIRKDAYDLCCFNRRQYCYLAWNLIPYRIFGKLEHDAYWSDDYIFFYRAAAVGPGIRVNGPRPYLIRNGSQNQSRGKDDNSRGYASILRMEHFNERYHSVTAGPLMNAYLQLGSYIRNTCSGAERDNALEFIEHARITSENNTLLANYWKKSPLYRYKINKRVGFRGMFALLRLLPLHVFAAVLATYRFIARK